MLPTMGDMAVDLIDVFWLNGIINLLPVLWDVWPNPLVEGIWEGMKNNVRESFKKNVTEFFTGIVDAVKEAMGIHSPSKSICRNR